MAACLPAIGLSLNRGQVNIPLLALLCAALAAAVRGRRFAAGLWLAGAVCVKIIPAYLLVYPLWTRDSRWLASSALGLVIGLGVIPAAVFGPARAAGYYGDLSRSVLQPGLNLGGDRSRANELIDMNATNSQSFQELFHNLLHNLLHPELTEQQMPASGGVRLAHWLLSGALTLVTLRAGAGRADSAIRTVIRFGALAMLMVAVSPASHDHYFCVNLPLVMGLVAAAEAGGGTRPPGRWLTLLLTGYVAASVLPMIPDLRILHDIRLPLLASLALWLAGILTLCRRPNDAPAVSVPVNSQ